MRFQNVSIKIISFGQGLFSKKIPVDWLVRFLNSQTGREYFLKASKQTTNRTIDMTQLRKCPVALPPLAEQQRIVAKVDQLLALCDALEAQLTQAGRGARGQLTAAVLPGAGG